MELQAIYKKFTDATENIPGIVKEKKASGQKVMGVIPYYAPEELIHAAGVFPIGCWGGQTSISKANTYLPPFACPLMQSVMEFAMNGVYDNLDAFLASAPCDTLKCITQDLITEVPYIKMITCMYPQNNKLEGAVLYLINELRKIKRQLEELTGRKISETAISESIKIYNKNREAMMDFTEIAGKNPGIISARMRHTVIKARQFMDKAEHTELMLELNEILRNMPKAEVPGQKIVLAGIMAEPMELLDIFDELRFYIVGDELAQESRQFRNPVPNGLDQIERLARQWQNVDNCGLVFDPAKKRTTYIANMAKELGADGVIFCQMKFCDPDEYDYPWVKKALDKVEIPILNLEIDINLRSMEQARTRLQAFSEQIMGLGVQARRA